MKIQWELSPPKTMLEEKGGENAHPHPTQDFSIYVRTLILFGLFHTL